MSRRHEFQTRNQNLTIVFVNDFCQSQLGLAVGFLLRTRYPSREQIQGAPWLRPDGVCTPASAKRVITDPDLLISAWPECPRRPVAKEDRSKQNKNGVDRQGLVRSGRDVADGRWGQGHQRACRTSGRASIPEPLPRACFLQFQSRRLPAQWAQSNCSAQPLNEPPNPVFCPRVEMFQTLT